MRTFGPFCLDPETGELTRNGLRLHLPPQPTKLLLLLTEAPPKLLSRREIQEKLWGDNTHVDFEQSLNFTIRQIRLALGDSAENPKYIETIPKRGYRFVADVCSIANNDTPDLSATQKPIEPAEPSPELYRAFSTPHWKISTWPRWAWGTLCLLFVGIAVWTACSLPQTLSVKVAPKNFPLRHEPPYKARDSYLQGLKLLSERSRDGFESALHRFSDAIEIDPQYAEAYAELATSYNLMGQYGWVSAKEARSMGRAAAVQALALDPSLASAHAALGFSRWFYDWDAHGGEEELLAAIRLDPNNVDAHHWYANLLMTQSRFAEAEQQMRQALHLDPKSPILRTNLGWLHYTAHDFNLALKEIIEVVREKPDFLTAHHKLWYIYAVQQNRPFAWKEFEWIANAGSDEHKAVTLAAYHKSGYAAALKAFANTPDSSSPGSIVDHARYLALAGEIDGALNLLEEAYERREGWLIFVPNDPAFEALHSTTKFQSLMRKVSSPVSEMKWTR